MTDKSLLVPIHLDAMVLNQKAQVSTPFLRFEMNYHKLKSFNSPEPDPFEGGSTEQPEAGIYLHWTLPQALRHGIHDEKSGITHFPLVPNRWLVTRCRTGATGSEALKAWILESDHLDDSTGTNPFVDPHTLGSGGTPTPTKLGRALRLKQELTTLNAQDKPFLRAVGPGTVTFCVFSPGVDNVFSFYDDVTENDDKSPIGQDDFTYYVAGWYGDPKRDDPLSGAKWSPKETTGLYINEQLKWLLYADTTPTVAQTLLHAQVSSVPWERNGKNPEPSDYPTDIKDGVKVAFGNTAIDALAAIVRLDRDSQTEADLLEAFNYGLLDQFDQPGSAQTLNSEIRKHWFSTSSGGTLWRVVPAKNEENPSLPTPSTPKLTLEQKKALDKLNSAQAEWDRQLRLLESAGRTLYELWWKTQWQKYNEPPVDEDFTEWLSTQLPLQIGEQASSGGSWQIEQVKKLQATTLQCETLVATARADLEKKLDPRQELKADQLPDYHSPNDPVLLVTGLGRSTNFDPGDGLVCRVASQTVSKLTVGGKGYGVDSSSDLDISKDIPVLDDPHGLLPQGVQAINTECFFLSPTLFAQIILGDRNKADQVRDGIKALPSAGANACFAPASFSFQEWIQPWIPLLLDWQVTVLKEPAYSCPKKGETAKFQREHWAFNGTDYQWCGPTQATGKAFNEEDSGQMTLTGRTFITPQISFSLATQLDQYVQKHKMRDPELEKLLEDLDKYLEQLAGHDILSQRLSGFSSSLVQCGHTQTTAPTGALKDAVGDQHRGIPKPFPDEHSSYADAVWDFAPQRGTFFAIDKLTVIDNFGRTIDLMLSNHSEWPHKSGTSSSPYFYPIAGRDLRSPTAVEPKVGRGKSDDVTQRMLQLTPRFVQDSKLDFKMDDAICGWFVPNHLNRSLSIYAPDGIAWGELYLSKHVKGYVPVWQPDPTNPQAPATLDDIPDSYIRGLLSALAGRTDNGEGFMGFMKVIDETLWSINPRGRRDDQNLSVLIGRPLAVVRADLSLKMRGTPLSNQDWWNLFDVQSSRLPSPEQPAELKRIDGGVKEYLWPVRLGSQHLSGDGTVGYYLDDPIHPDSDFSVFNSVMLPEEIKTDYLRQIGPKNYLNLKSIDDTCVQPDPKKNETCSLTMLVDPRGSVHAFSGLLPVAKQQLCDDLVSDAFRQMAYTFRAGPFLTSPEQIVLPRPAEQQGTWSWFDRIINSETPIANADGKVRFPTTPPLIKEGWMKFKPNTEDESS